MTNRTLSEHEAVLLVADQLTLLPFADQRARAAQGLIAELMGRRNMAHLGDHQDFNACAKPHYRITRYGSGTGEYHLSVGPIHTTQAMITVSHHLNHPGQVTVEIA